MNANPPTIAVLGASGLIGQAVSLQLEQMGLPVVPIARRFNNAQADAFGGRHVEAQVVDCTPAELGALFTEKRADIVVNCIGVLQDSTRGNTGDVHGGFAERMVTALGTLARPCLLIHISVPGRPEDDRTAFSSTKREAERVIAASPVPYVILRPGFVVAQAAYGGSALLRALGALPFDLPRLEHSRPFAATDIVDITRSIVFVARRWRKGEQQWHAVWDVMEREASSVGEVVAAFRQHLGTAPPRFRMPSWLMEFGAKAGDAAARLGWSPPIRSTALAEMRRGVNGDSATWIAATGIEPVPLACSLVGLPATIQDKWFARLYLAKPLVIGSLVLFWIVSGLIALTIAFEEATAILIDSGFAPGIATAMTIVSSLADIAIGAAIATRRSCRLGLIVGIGLSLLYMAGAVFFAPALWADPLGALVKTGPAIVLMLVALAILPER